MLMLADSDMIHLNNAALYNAWKGPLYIREQLVCHIALQASSTCSIPAQLSEKLDIKEVIPLSELRKKLPEDVFQKTNLTGQEVSCGDIYYSLYPVKTSNIVGSELDKVQKCLKDQDLALIKVLNDRGFLILGNFAVLQSNTGICGGNSAHLNALFLFPHKKLLDKREREDWECKFIRKELPLTISNLLPGLHYALIESSKLQKDKALYPGPLVEQYFRKYAVFQSQKGSSPEDKAEQSEPLSLFYSPSNDLPEKFSPLAFTCLQLYISSPINFNVPLIKMSNVFTENASLSSNSDRCSKTVGNVKPDFQSKLSMTAALKTASDKLQGNHAVHDDKEQHSKRSKKRKGKRREKKSKRKSVHRAALSSAETEENRATSKRRRLLSEGKKQIGASSEVTVKLASAPYSQSRNRGAEVLTAALIQDKKVQTTEKMASSKKNEENKNLTPTPKNLKTNSRKILTPEEHFLVPDRPLKRKASDPGHKNMSVGAINKSKSLKRTNERNGGKTDRDLERSQKKVKNITVEQINTFSKSSENFRDANKPPPTAQISEDSMMEKRISMYESHALNLLADLALNSFGSTSIPYIISASVASANESVVEEAASTGDCVSSVEHPQKDCSLPVQSNRTFTEPEKILESDKPKNGLNVSPRNIASQKRTENSEKQISQKAHIAAAKAKARHNTTSKISLEHSYSQLPIDDIPGKSAKEASEQPIQVVPDSTTPADIVPDPLYAGLLPEEIELLTGENVVPATCKKQRAVSKLQDNFVITFHWDPKYDFDLDSKFTSNPLEKTINRALHGPWNPHLKEKVEDVKIILHMWLALFYSKSSKQRKCTSRKVVEHSNPAKYVSINTVLDPFEFYEITESDAVPSSENTNVVPPMEKKSEAPHQVNPLGSVLSCKLKKSERKSLQDLTVPFGISTKAMLKESEHKYSRDFSSLKKAASSQNDCELVSSNVDRQQGNVKVYEMVSSAGSTSHSDILQLHDVIMPPTTGDGHETTFKLKFADQKSEYSCTQSKTIYSPGIPTADDLNKDITSENPASVDRLKDLVKEAELSIQMMSLLDARITTCVDNHKTAAQISEIQDVLQASILPSRELNDHSTIADEPPKSPAVALQNSEDHDEPMTITNKSSVMVIESPSDHNDVKNTEFCMDKRSNMEDPLIDGEALKRDKDSSEINLVDADNLPTVESLDTNVHSPSMHSKDLRNVSGHTDHIASKQGPQKMQMEGLEIRRPDLSKNMNSNMSVDCNSTKEGKTDAVFDSVESKDRHEKATGNFPDESGNPVERKLGQNVLNEITPTGKTSRLELSNISDEESVVECTKSCTTGDSQSGEQESMDKSVNESSEKTEGKEEHSIVESIINTSVERSMPAIYTDNSDDPKKDHDVKQKDVHASGHVSKSSMVDEAEKEVPEKPFFTLKIDQPCLREDVDLLNSAVTDEGTKELEPSNGDVNLKSDRAEGSLPEASKKEVPSTQEKAATDHEEVPLVEKSQDDTCLDDELSSAGTEACEMDGVVSTSVLEDLDIEGSSESCTMEVSVQYEKQEGHVHKEDLAECQNHPLLSQAPFEKEKIKSNPCSVKNVNEEDDNSVVKEIQIDASATKAETAVDMSVSVGLSKDTREGEPDVNDTNEKTCRLSDQSMKKCSEMDSEQSVEKQPADPIGNAVYSCPTVKLTETISEDLTHSSRNSGNTKKEILSKLKRICLGTLTAQQVSCNFESVLSHDKDCINSGFTKEKNQLIDVAKDALLHDGDKSTLKNCDVIAEESAIDLSSPQESAITTVDFVETETPEAVMPPQDHILISPISEDVSDNMEQDPSELPDMCFIVNTGSISKEQYDRWSETSDEDIEYIRSYKEPISHQKHFQKEIHKSPNLYCDKVARSPEPATTDGTKKCFQKQASLNTGLYGTNKYFPKHLLDLKSKSIPNHDDVILTKYIQNPAVRTINKESSSKDKSDRYHLYSDRRRVSDDLTQNTLEMENVRFLCKLKETLRKSSADQHVCGPSFQTMFESRRIPSCSHSTTKCKSPLLITVRCPYRRTNFRRRESWHPSTYNSSSYYVDELWDRPVTYSRTIKKVRTPRYSSFHFSRLRYENTLDKSSTDVSVILKECAQSNHLKLRSVGLDSTSVDRTAASQLVEEGAWQARRSFVPVSSKSKSVKNIITDLCTSLHSRLQKVASSSAQRISFYIHETNDDEFISSAKSLLLKDGHIPTDPRDFLHSEHSESHRLLVIIKNEAVLSCINKIPYLMQLKLLPNVTFAGVDTPEDITESTYEELFKAGGFVASDKSVLENITLGKLKEVLAVLEKMNRSSPWKWLIHYRENRKLKEDKRAEAVSPTKMSMLKSYQPSNVIEILPYHQCDSRSKEPSDDLSCLLNLQYQHIHSRLAVYLTGTTSPFTEEFEQNGILVYDVDTFLRKIQKVHSQFQASYWS
ncbi:protein TASOR 2 isoform X2 [Rhinoderma darwinii]|uniref:protein TASOR 2 isoform X2 n=1 Tax=Rhinoderma darwinii TaxID=43563 RepID=UPI003F670871